MTPTPLFRALDAARRGDATEAIAALDDEVTDRLALHEDQLDECDDDIFDYQKGRLDEASAIRTALVSVRLALEEAERGDDP